MEQATTVFLAGVLGVFLGMALIFIAIKVTARIAAYFESDEEPS